ncbi:thiopeptide-type bacteriocin biosynthesis protein [Chryseobacterium binzhouense]|uniref:thiopeptide-type bacteriocin biosynthesis protein n=1 Tax=Chryseobacterium binzhouense TaxID=2593646 RepID=UPI00117FF163|nr:thiopeptide-type bacteriocin biosynthesis protein [Chryseobacterium binzhouense]
MSAKRKFFPGSEWLYFKVYTGIKTADLVLEELMPLIDSLEERNQISKWFFIRYNDPKPHLRIRFNLAEKEFFQSVVQEINNGLESFLESGEISDISVNTYTRELERYGYNTIENAESFFFINSKITLEWLEYDDEEKLLVSIFYIECLLNLLKLSITEKSEWIKRFNDAFKAEFNADKNLNSQLDKKYRTFKLKYIEFLHSPEFSSERNQIVSNLFNIESDIQVILSKNKTNSLDVNLPSFFQSIFHMNINRLFVSDQRLFEMVVYDFLNRHCKSLLYLNSKTTSAAAPLSP